MSNSALSGSGQPKPPDAPTGSAACSFVPNSLSLTDAPHILVSRACCDFAPCVQKHAKRGVSHGAFLYELRWGVVEHAGMLLAAVSLATMCHQCGTLHTRIEVPRSTAHPPLIAAT